MAIKLRVSYEQQGNAFDPGYAVAELDKTTLSIEKDLGQLGVNMVRQQLGRVLKRPTGYYSSHVVTDLAVTDVAVTDSNVVYGPWLEGTSSRNARTRFKGYRTFRIVGQQLEARAASEAEKAVSRTVQELNR